MLTRSLVSELRATLAVAAPLAAANVAQMLMGFTDTVMVGRLGALPLAAAGLGAMLYFTIGVVLQGIVTGVAPLAAHAIGAGDRPAAARIANEGLVLAALLSLPFFAGTVTVERMLHALGYDAVLAAEIGRFLRAIAWGAPAFLGFSALRSYLAALSRTRPVMVVLLLCVAANAGLNWVLIYGHLGAPALGVAGSGYASATVQWLMLSGLALYIGLAPSLAATRMFRGVLARRWGDMRAILRVGLPIGGLLGLEIGVFMTTGVLMGLLGADTLGAHQIVLNCAALTFMVPLGVSQAATVRVALEMGRGRPAAARRAGFVALALGVAFMGAAAVVLWTVPRAVIAVYINIADAANREVVAIGLRLMVIAALFQVFDGMQTVAAGALRGYRDTLVPMLLAGIGYWGIGFVGGWLLAFPLGYGAVGLWWGLALGLAVVAALLTWRLHLVGNVTSSRLRGEPGEEASPQAEPVGRGPAFTG